MISPSPRSCFRAVGGTFAIWLALADGNLNAANLPIQNSSNVRDFGAVADGKSLDTPAINQAIDTATAAGGGTVLVPAGTYLSGSIHLQSNIRLLIDAGATILAAPQELSDYDETKPYPEPIPSTQTLSIE